MHNIMTTYNLYKGNTYEEFVLNHLLNDYDNVYFFRDTPEYIISKTKLYANYDLYLKYKNCDIGADLVAVKNDIVYFVQCKNFSNIISINDFCSFYFLVLEFELNGIVYYNGILSERLTDLSQGKIKYNNLPYNNTIIDVNFHEQQNTIIIPRDYQIDIYNKFQNIERGIIALCCGLGKTYSSWMIGKDYKNIIIISPTRNLADSNLVQLYNYSSKTYNPILISMDGSRNCAEITKMLKDKNIISATYDSVDVLNKIIKHINNYIIIVDEFHNLSKNNLENTNDPINKLLTLSQKIIYLSATPIYNKKYVHLFGNYIYKYKWTDAINRKYICDFKFILPDDTFDTKIFTDFLNNIEYDEENRDLVIKSFFILKGINFYNNKKTILYASNIEEANEYLNIINWMKILLNIDINAYIIDYKTSKTNRIEYLKKFKTNTSNNILINVQILNEGIDIPECDSVFITKPNDNIINLVQRMCRCNRLFVNKHTANIYMWCNKNNKIFNYFKKYIDGELNIEYMSTKKIYNSTIENTINNIDTKKNEVISETKTEDTVEINGCIIKKNNIKTTTIEFIKKYCGEQFIILEDKNNKIWFSVTQICCILKYSNPCDITYKLVDKKYIVKLKDIVDDYKIFSNSQPNSLFVDEFGLYLLLIKGKKNEANDFLIYIIKNIN